MMGAAIATVAAYTVMFAGMAWWAQRIFPCPYQWRRVLTAAAAGIALATAGKLLDGGLPLAPDRLRRRFEPGRADRRDCELLVELARQTADANSTHANTVAEGRDASE